MMSLFCRAHASNAAAVAVLGLLATGEAARAQWSDFAHYQIERIGLYSSEYTAANGTQLSTPAQISQGGQVYGVSTRYAGDTALSGSRPWVWTGTSTVQLGFVGGQHQGTAGRENHFVAGITDAGQVAGHSIRLNGIFFNGADSWVWTGAEQVRIGMIDAAYTAASGRQESRVILQNAAGQVAGFSSKYIVGDTEGARTAWVWKSGVHTQIGLGLSSSGFSFDTPRLQNAVGMVAGNAAGNPSASIPSAGDAWVWDGASTQRIGLVGPEYTAPISNSRHNEPTILSPDGKIVGIAARRGVLPSTGFADAWIWDGSTTTRIGLVGSRYGESGPDRNSKPLFLNAAGQAAGYSTLIHNNQFAIGQDSWVWNGSETVQIGLVDGVHTSGSTEYRKSQPTHMSASGMIAGWSARYRDTAGTIIGQSAWIWDGITTQRIGLFGPGYVGAIGIQESTPLLMNDAGQTVGTSIRYGPGEADGGQDAWIWRNNITSSVGLTGGVYEGSNGFRTSTPRFQNAAGIVVGTSSRIGGISDIVGTDGWYFDPASGLTTSIIGDVRDDGFTDMTLRFLTDTGFVFGNYKFFENGTGAGVDRAFVFRPDLGLTDLGALVEGGLGDAGWAELYSALRLVDLTYIVGRGFVNGQTLGGSAYIMVLPAPGSLALLGLGALAVRRRR